MTNLISTSEAIDRIEQATGRKLARATLLRWAERHPALAIRLGGRRLFRSPAITAIARGERLEVAAGGTSDPAA